MWKILLNVTTSSQFRLLPVSGSVPPPLAAGHPETPALLKGSAQGGGRKRMHFSVHLKGGLILFVIFSFSGILRTEFLQFALGGGQLNGVRGF